MREQQQWVFKDALRKHLSYVYSNGQIQWPKRFTKFHVEEATESYSLLFLTICITKTLI